MEQSRARRKKANVASFWRHYCISRLPILLLFLQCSTSLTRADNDDDMAVVDLSKDWVVSPLYNKNQGYCKMQADVAPLGQVRGYIVLQQGQVVAEGYHEEGDRTGFWQSNSLTKSWSTMLLGKVVELELLDVTETLGDIFDQSNDWIGVKQANKKRTVLVQELLSMTSGLVPCIVQSNLAPKETLQEVLNTVDYETAQRGKFYYADQFHILGQIILRRTGLTPRQFAIQSGIFPKLGLNDTDYQWDTFGGVEGTAIGFRTNPRVHAKLGQLYLQQGRASPSEQLIPIEWIATSTTDQLRDDDINFISLRGSLDGYGYQWVVNKDDYQGELEEVVASLGFQGQIIAYDPRTSTTLAMNGKFPIGGGASYTLMKNIIQYALDGDYTMPQDECNDDDDFSLLPYVWKNGCDIATDLYNQIVNIARSIFV